MQRNRIECAMYGCGFVFTTGDMARGDLRSHRNEHTGQEGRALELRCPKCGSGMIVLEDVR